MSSCERFEEHLCLGCVGLEYNIDELKKYCERYQKYEEGEQMKWENFQKN